MKYDKSQSSSLLNNIQEDIDFCTELLITSEVIADFLKDTSKLFVVVLLIPDCQLPILD